MGARVLNLAPRFCVRTAEEKDQAKSQGAPANGGQGDASYQMPIVTTLFKQWRGLPQWLRTAIRITGWIAGWLAYLLIVTIGLYLLSRFVGPNTDPVNFVTANLLTAVLAALVAVQAYIYFGQLSTMRDTLEENRKQVLRAISPRLRVDEVRAVGFEIGQSPAFMVSLVNEGATEAQDVALYVEAERGGVRAYWRGEQIVTVPANDRRMYPIRWSEVLSQEVIDAYSNNEPWLKVFGHFKYKDIEQPFCYHYYPWIGKRPAEVPYFVPCDFDVRNDVNITLGIADATHGHLADSVALSGGNKSSEEAQPQEEIKTDQKDDQQASSS